MATPQSDAEHLYEARLEYRKQLMHELEMLDQNDYHPNARAEANLVLDELRAVESEIAQFEGTNPRPGASGGWVRGTPAPTSPLENFKVGAPNPGYPGLEVPNNQFDTPAIDLRNMQDPAELSKYPRPFSPKKFYKQPVQMKFNWGGPLKKMGGPLAVFGAMAAGDPTEAAASMVPGWPGTTTLDRGEVPITSPSRVQWDNRGRLAGY